MPSRTRFVLPSLLAVVPVLALSGELATATPAVPAAAVGWPPASGVLLSEVATGGASASDEFVELYNAGAAPVELAPFEVAHITASGSTITRKVSWPGGQVLAPGQHLLAANAAGAYAAVADGTYSGGLAATGGALVLRRLDGRVLDAIGWGDATNGFVEGLAAPAPGAGMSLERLPGGELGSWQDGNDNASDWIVRSEPSPEGLLDPPVPAANPPGSQSPPPSQASPSPAPSSTPTAPASVPAATPTDSPAAMSPPPSVSPTATASTDVPSTIAQARSLAEGAPALVEGVLTAPLGLLDEGRGAFVQDATAGIALYLASGTWPPASAGTHVRARGTLDQRYAQTTLRVASRDDLAVLDTAAQPAPLAAFTGASGEALEGSLVRVAGRISAGPDTLSDGFAVDIDDGSGALRVIAGAMTGIVPTDLARGSTVALVGVLGQRDSSGTGEAGYRLYVRLPPDVTVIAVASPSPSPSSSPTASPSASPPPSPTPGPGGSGTPAPDQVAPIASVLARSGAHVRVAGTVTSPSTTWGVDGRRVTIQDPTAAILVRLPRGVRAPGVGQRIEVSGRIGHYLGAVQLEADSGPKRIGGGALAPRAIGHGPIGEAWTWRLAIAAGRVLEARHGATSWRAELQLSDGSRLPVGGGLVALAGGRRVVVGARMAVTGIVRPPASGASDPRRYLVARSASDVTVIHAGDSGATRGAGGSAAGAASGVAGASGAPGAAGGLPLEVDLADLADLGGRLVRAGGIVVEADVTSLLIDDGTAQAAVRAAPSATPGLPPYPLDASVGVIVNVVGIVTEAQDGWEIRLRTPADLTLAGQLESSPGTEDVLVGGSPGSASEAARSDPASVAADQPGAVLALGAALASALAVIAAAGALGWRWRRRRARQLEARIGARLAALVEPLGPTKRTPVRSSTSPLAAPERAPTDR